MGLVGGLMSKKSSGLILENSLQSFFFDELKLLNDKSFRPLPNELIYYSSLVMDHFGESQNYFEFSEEGVKNKVLGIKMMEAAHLSTGAQKRRYREVGDTALFLCGYFSESVSRKIIDVGYYHSLGVSAYKKLNILVPEVYDVENFFKQFSHSFQSVTELMGIVSQKCQGDFADESILIISSNKKSA